MKNWISVKEKLPEQFVVVLTIHEDDLYPVPAYLYDISENIWVRETEGPEDKIIEGRYRQLFQPPTHWMPLPKHPKKGKI